MDPVDRRAFLAMVFAQRYGDPPSIWVRAPGRVDLMGSHTDYNDGHVLTMTVDRDVWLAARPRPDRRVAIASLDMPGSAEFDLDAIGHDPVVHWTDYVRGVAQVLVEEGLDLVGFDGFVHSTVPFGSGLSSSAALEVATLLGFGAASGFRLEPLQAAILGQRAENEFVGVSCGILDQYTSIFGEAGHALLLDCRHLVSRPVAIAPHLAVVICDTRSERRIGVTGYGERRAQCEEGVARLRAVDHSLRALRDVSPEMLAAHEDALSPVVARRCRFILEEERRVLDLEAALRAGDRQALGDLFAASWDGANRLFEIVSPAMTAMRAAISGAPGFIAGRQAGGGFGGCLVALVERGDVDAFRAHVERTYRAATSIAPVVFPVEAAPGAGPVGDP
jgi:galactokinase